VLGRFANNRKKASPILLLPQERLESIRTRFPVQRFAKTAKKTRTETKAAQTLKNVLKKLSLSNASGSEAILSKVSQGLT
jgi:hypothetical protein